MRYSLGNPLPGHAPDVGRTMLGLSPTSPARPVYGTTLWCSCREIGRRTVSNEAPSLGGRVAAQAEYRAHVEEVLAREAAT